MPHFGDGRLKGHPVAEEMYIVQGSVEADPYGHMVAGSYRYTPPFVFYGPNNVPDGCLLLVRSFGKLSTFYTEALQR